MDLPEPVGPTMRTSPRGWEMISLICCFSSGARPRRSRFNKVSSKLKRRRTAS